jgi:alkylhydroperoxidase/carboxymuconolactone decarboxylase family protein YurZ
MPSAEDALRRLAINDEREVAALMGAFPGVAASCALEPRAQALARVSALIAIDAGQVALEHGVSDAIAQGASSQDIVALLSVIAPAVGYARVVAAAPAVASALGYDIDTSLEALGR